MASPEIPITGIASDFRVPGSYAEILFNQGPATASAPTREVCFVMPKSSAGTWTAATLYRVKNEYEAEVGGGAGSPIHRAIRMFLKSNKSAKVWAVPVAPTSGGSPAAATAVLTISGTASGTGTITVTVDGETSSATFSNGMTATQIGALVAESVNAKTYLPCIATNVSGTVTFAAKVPGTSQGTSSLGIHRVRVEITSGVTTTASFGGAFLGTGAVGAEGSTSEATNTETALNSIVARRFYYVETSGVDATTLAKFKTHLVTKSEPRQGLRSVCVAAYPGTLGDGATLATGLNYERIQIAWQRNPENSVEEIAANVAAVRQAFEVEDSAANWVSDSRIGARWLIKPAYDTADWPDADDQNDAINDGLMPIASREGASYPVMSVDTRSKNPTGAVDDFRSCETHRISVADEFTDELLATTALRFGNGKKLKDDEFLSDGSVNPNQKKIRNVITPSMVKATAVDQLTNYEQDGKLQNVQASKDGLRVVKSPANGARVEGGLDLNAIDHAHQFTWRIAETSTG
jgi:phage tail sheath gpL-like